MGTGLNPPQFRLESLAVDREEESRAITVRRVEGLLNSIIGAKERLGRLRHEARDP